MLYCSIAAFHFRLKTLACSAFFLLGLALQNTVVAQPTRPSQADSIELSQKNRDTIVPTAKDTGSITVKDRTIPIETIKKFARVQATRNKAKYEDDRTRARQALLFAELRATARKITEVLIGETDTMDYYNRIQSVTELRNVASDGIFANRGTAQSARNLEASRVLLRDLLDQTEADKVLMQKKADELAFLRSRVDSLESDSILYIIPGNDSVAVMDFINKLRQLSKEVDPADSLLTDASKFVRSYLSQFTVEQYGLQSDLKQIDDFRESINSHQLRREFANLWEPRGFSRPFSDVASFSAKKGWLVFKFYCSVHWFRIVVMLVLIVLVARYLVHIRQDLKDKQVLYDYTKEHVVLRYPWLSAVVIVISVFQFFFEEPPFVFIGSLWVVSGLALIIILNGYVSPFWNKGYNLLFALFVLAYLDNNILQATRPERWLMLFLSLAGIAYGAYLLLKGDRKELKEKYIVVFILIMVALEVVAFFANLFGRYNLAKIWLSAGYFNMVIGIMMLWSVRFINDALQLSTDSFKAAYNRIFYLDFNKVNRSVPTYVYVVLGIGWFVLVARNFYFYTAIRDGIGDLLGKERAIGQYSFSISSIVIFFGIIVLSTIVSKIVSFFASESHEKGSKDSGMRSAIGNWLLLIRIAIISLGVLLAFAAAGIPLDKLTIIISALGVGIGFGLQTVVNNLVSGLIIAFEKPINVGDVVEIGTQSGVMKSIGFRSSMVSTWDGADVIIPNGDLLNQHLVNWTLNSKTRRVEILVGVAYGTDLPFVVEKLKELLEADPRVMRKPEPAIFVTTFNSSSIDFRILFWVADYNTWLMVKSDTILAIDKLFKENNITIPFPQQDIYIKSGDAKRLTEVEDQSEEMPSEESPSVHMPEEGPTENSEG